MYLLLMLVLASRIEMHVHFHLMHHVLFASWGAVVHWMLFLSWVAPDRRTSMWILESTCRTNKSSSKLRTSQARWYDLDSISRLVMLDSRFLRHMLATYQWNKYLLILPWNPNTYPFLAKLERLCRFCSATNVSVASCRCNCLMW